MAVGGGGLRLATDDVTIAFRAQKWSGFMIGELHFQGPIVPGDEVGWLLSGHRHAAYINRLIVSCPKLHTILHICGPRASILQ